MDEALGGVRSMLVAASPSDDGGRVALSKPRVLAVIGRRSLPALLEATVAPALIFYVMLIRIGPGAAMLGALAWSYGAVARRLLSHRRVTGILVLAVVGLTVRTIVGLLSGTFIYFLQPILTTLVLSGVFLVSMLIGRPVVARLADDFCPLAPEIASRPSVVRLFSMLTLLWAGVHLLTAATTFGLLVSLPTATFVVLKTAVSLGITVGAVALTISESIRIARSENLVFARVMV
jgi:hypothetical protein